MGMYTFHEKSFLFFVLVSSLLPLFIRLVVFWPDESLLTLVISPQPNSPIDQLDVYTYGLTILLKLLSFSRILCGDSFDK